MNQKIKKKWVDALRSGNYLQGMGWLAYEGQYSCLGVLCDVMCTFACYYEGFIDALPHFVMKRAGLNKDVEHMLYYANDVAGYSFSEIADWIEENL